MNRTSLIGWAVAFALLASLPWLPAPIGTPYHLELGAQVLTMAIFALSLQLLVGFTGLVSLGHAAFFGVAAYAVTVLAPEGEAGNGWLLLLAAVGTAAGLALLIGLLVMRAQAVYFIMVTLAFAQLVYFVAHDSPWFHGSDGAYLYFKPAFKLGEWTLIDLDQAATLYGFTLACTALTVVVLTLVLRSRFGHALVGIQHNEQRMRAAGFSTLGYKLGSFVLAGALAGLAGFLYATRNGYVNPDILSWHQSGNALVMIILGGLGSLPGAVIGAAAFVLLSEAFQALTPHWQLLLGGFIIVIVALLPKGLVGLPALLRRTPLPTPRPSPQATPRAAPSTTPSTPAEATP